MKKQILQRKVNETVKKQAKESGLSSLLAYMLACRTDRTDIDFKTILEPKGTCIPHPDQLMNIDNGADRIVQAVISMEDTGIVADFDCDGHNGNCVITKSFLDFFNHPPHSFKSFVGNRLTEGYGLTEKLCDRILDLEILPTLIITTDCGSSDEAQIKRLKEQGIDVIVTDHHETPKEGVPASAYCTINPKQPGCSYPDKDVAGCMVAWLIMCVVRTKLNERGYFKKESPKLTPLLDYVAVGTIADAVSLMSATNRFVIQQGLKILNTFQRPCWRAMRELLNLQKGKAIDPQDIGFQLAPRINARSRMNDPYAALYFLLAETDTTAREYLAVLEKDNTARKELQNQMAEIALEQVADHWKELHHSIVAFDPSFHAGVQGIVASRLTDKYGVPTIVISPTNTEGVCSGSARTIESVHIRDVLQAIDDEHPGLMLQFGGHHGAAGLKISLDKIHKFRTIFNKAVISALGSDQELLPVVTVDASLVKKGLIHMGCCKEIQKLQPFGQGFEEPLFGDRFTVKSIKLVGKPAVHLKLDLEDKKDQRYQGIWFSAIDKEGDPVPVAPKDTVNCAYSLNINHFRGRESLQLMIKHAA